MRKLKMLNLITLAIVLMSCSTESVPAQDTPQTGTTQKDTLWNINNNGIDYTGGYVGIGTSEPKERFQIGDNWFFHDNVTKAMLYNAFWNGRNWEYSSDGPMSFIELNMARQGTISMGTAQEGTKGGNANTTLKHNLTINNGGNIGINNEAPERSLHINNVMRLEPRNTAPDLPKEGDIYMDSTTHKLMVFDGSVWQSCW